MYLLVCSQRSLEAGVGLITEVALDLIDEASNTGHLVHLLLLLLSTPDTIWISRPYTSLYITALLYIMPHTALLYTMLHTALLYIMPHTLDTTSIFFGLAAELEGPGWSH